MTSDEAQGKYGANDTPVFFGVDGSTGSYLLSGAPEELARVALRDTLPSAHLADLKARLERARPGLGVVDAVDDITDLAQTGWGVIFGARASDAIRDALRGLLDLRRAQATRAFAHFYQEYTYQPGETKAAFLRRYGVPPSGAADPQRMPYYLLLVGAPDEIPFEFQYALDVQYAVGRICFGSSVEYAQYAQSVIAAETQTPRSRRAVFFGVQNPDDAATALSAQGLVRPLADAVRSTASGSRRPSQPDWQIDTIDVSQTTKAQLARFLGGDQTPALLFTASHGLAFPCGHPRQADEQGALVCADWPGPRQWRHELPTDFAFGGQDVSAAANLQGLIAFHFACFGAGTPEIDQYPQLAPGQVGDLGPIGPRLARPIASRAFVAPLAQKLLGHAGGGALAVIGHVERALGASFLWSAEGRQHSAIKPFEDVVGRLVRGMPVGAALEPLNQRYAETCAELSQAVREVEQSGKLADVNELARLWVGSTDARGYIVLGDPAARLAPLSAPDRPDFQEATRVHATPTPPTQAPAPAPRPDDSLAEPSVAVTNLLRETASGIHIDIDTRTGHVRILSPSSGSAHDSRGLIGGGSEDVSYSLFGATGGTGFADLRTSIGDGLTAAATGLSQAVTHLLGELSTLEVTTYTSDDLASVDIDPDTGHLSGVVKKRAMTRMRLDGQTVAIIPERDGKIDEQFWALHCGLVDRAQAQRAELLKSALSAVTNLMDALKAL